MARVLLLGDDTKSLDALSTLIAADGHRVEARASVHDGAALWPEFEPQTLVLDVASPTLWLHRLERRLGPAGVAWAQRPVLLIGAPGTLGPLQDEEHLLIALSRPLPDAVLVGHVRGLCRLQELLCDAPEDTNASVLPGVEPSVRDHLAAKLLAIAEYRDTSEPGHGRRVAHVASAIGRFLGLATEEIGILERAGRWHDLGKLAVAPEILRRPRELEPGERDALKEHPRRGALVVGELLGDRRAAGAVRGHHERLDGGGYEGTPGDKLSIRARILAAAEAWDALTHHQTYRPAFSRDEALELLRRERGAAWDPVVVDALDRLTGGGPARRVAEH